MTVRISRKNHVNRNSGQKRGASARSRVAVRLRGKHGIRRGIRRGGQEGQKRCLVKRIGQEKQ